MIFFLNELGCADGAAEYCGPTLEGEGMAAAAGSLPG
jgi:hypothetical protein